MEVLIGKSLKNDPFSTAMFDYRRVSLQETLHKPSIRYRWLVMMIELIYTLSSNITTGWWFGTFFIFPYLGNVIIPIDFHIFQRITHQTTIDNRWWLVMNINDWPQPSDGQFLTSSLDYPLDFPIKHGGSFQFTVFVTTRGYQIHEYSNMIHY